MKVNIGPYTDRGKRLEDIHIHDDDTWNMDQTLALIILPMLKQLKATKHGVPVIDFKDMPAHLQFIPRQYDNRAIKDLFNDRDDFNVEFEQQVKCWNWILDEMIWAVEQIVSVNDIDPEIWYTKEFQDRISHGLVLFGRYYQSLWD